MQRMLTETEKLEIIEHQWAKARAKNPEVIMRVNVQDETDESGKPRVNVVIAFSGTWASIENGQGRTHPIRRPSSRPAWGATVNSDKRPTAPRSMRSPVFKLWRRCPAKVLPARSSLRYKSRQVRWHQWAGKRPGDKSCPPNLRGRICRSDASSVYSIL